MDTRVIATVTMSLNGTNGCDCTLNGLVDAYANMFPFVFRFVLNGNILRMRMGIKIQMKFSDRTPSALWRFEKFLFKCMVSTILAGKQNSLISVGLMLICY